MIPFDLVGLAFVLVASVTLGIIAHELAHALTLRAFGIPYTFESALDRRGAGVVKSLACGTLAAVTPQVTADRRVSSRLRIAAMMPLVLASPLALVPLGILPDPFSTGDLPLQVAVIGWSACAIPSPRDFSVLWYADRAILESATADPSRP